MAKKKNADNNRERPAPGIVVPLIVMTLLAAGSGTAFAMIFASPKPKPAEAAAPQQPPKAVPVTLSAKYPADTVAVPLAPILTNIGEGGTFVRVEGSILVPKGSGGADVLSAEISEDITAYIRTLTMSDIAGARGFQNLREDLNDRARIRSKGAVLGLVIYGLVLE